MENYIVTYRGKDGKQQTLELVATDRADVFRQLNARHVSAIKVEQSTGKRKPPSFPRARRAPGSSRLFKGVIITSIGVIGAAVAAWLVLSQNTETEDGAKDKKFGMIREVTPNITSNATDNVTAPEENVEEEKAEVKEPQPKPRKVIRPRSSRTGMVMTMMDGTVVTNTPRVFFTRDFEKSLHVALHPGGMASALLRNVRAKYSDDEILSMLKELTLPDPDDDETAIGVKNKVQTLKEDILTAIDNGSTVSQVFDEMIKQCTSESLLRADAFKAKIEAIRTGDPEVVRDSMRQINQVLESNGLKKMDVPIQFREPEGEPEDSSQPNQEQDETTEGSPEESVGEGEFTE